MALPEALRRRLYGEGPTSWEELFSKKKKKYVPGMYETPISELPEFQEKEKVKPKVTGRTEEEVEQARKEGRAFISDVEKAKHKLMEAGAGEKRASEQALQQIVAAMPGPEAKPPPSPEDLRAAIEAQRQGLPLTEIQQELLEKEGQLQLPPLETQLEAGAETIAGVGLWPAKKIAEIIKPGLELLVGREIELEKTADLVDTDWGKALGLTTAVVATVQLGALVGPALLGASSKALGTVGSALGLKTGFEKLIIGGASLWGAAQILNYNPTIIADIILDRDSAKTLAKAGKKMGSLSEPIEKLAREGYDPYKLLAKADAYELDLFIIEGWIEQAAIKEKAIQTESTYIKIMADIGLAKAKIEASRAVILNNIDAEWNSAGITEAVDMLTALGEERKEELLEKRKAGWQP